jgi:hypothetical protein
VQGWLAYHRAAVLSAGVILQGTSGQALKPLSAWIETALRTPWHADITSTDTAQDPGGPFRHRADLDPAECPEKARQRLAEGRERATGECIAWTIRGLPGASCGVLPKASMRSCEMERGYHTVTP